LAIIAHVLQRAIRIEAAEANSVEVTKVRPITSLRFLRGVAGALVDALSSEMLDTWLKFIASLGKKLVVFALEPKPSARRARLARQMGANGV
jgi:hypothetical protein